jgi:tetratricopeptide (TPR) repeat protein
VKSAIEDLGKAIDLEPKEASRYADRGRLLLQDRNPAAALSDFEKAIQLSPDLHAELAPLVADCQAALQKP